MLRWLMGRDAGRGALEQALASLDERVWPSLLARYRFLSGLSTQESETLRQHTAWILANKSFHGAHGLLLTPDMCRSIAVQAALPVLGLDTSLYRGWTQIVVYPGGFLVPRTETDEAGVVHESRSMMAGEAWGRGPVILSWASVLEAGKAPGRNVVVHEMAHKLDMLNGATANGFPPLHRGMDRKQWTDVFSAAWHRLHEARRDGEPLPIDPYGLESPAEFFAVVSEQFFEAPAALREQLPRVYGELTRFYRQHPY